LETALPRMGVHSPEAGHSPSGPSSDIAKELALYRQRAPAARDILDGMQLWTPDGLWGMPLLNRLNEATLKQTLAAIPDGTWELMTHPGYRDRHDRFDGPERETELTALTAPSICQLIAEHGIELTTFGTCACAC